MPICRDEPAGAKIEVEIIGKRYSLRMDHAPAHLLEVADHVNAKLQDLIRQDPTLRLSNAAALVCVILTDELLNARDAAHQSAGDTLARIGDIVRLFEQEAMPQSDERGRN
jgi:cell division protein ZapA (FtsZ GTPase activity inhibitor)